MMGMKRYLLTPESVEALKGLGQSIFRLSVESGANHAAIHGALKGKPVTERTMSRLKGFMPGLEFTECEEVSYRGFAGGRKAADETPCGIDFVRRLLPDYIGSGGEPAIHVAQERYPALCDDGRWRL